MRQWMYRLIGLAFAIAQLGCHKQPSFNPALAGRFFPLVAGSSWLYRMVYADGTRETIADRIVRADQTQTSRAGVLVVSDLSGLHGSRAVRMDLFQTYPDEMTEVETRYILEGGYITRVQSLGEPSWIRLEEHRFLPQYLWPDRAWSNTLTPFADLPNEILTVGQNHRTFLEEQDVVVPAGHFADCIRVETEASYQSPAGNGTPRFFTDWYAPDIGLVKTIVLVGDHDGREIARIELLRFAKPKSTVRGDLSNKQPDSSVIGEKP